MGKNQENASEGSIFSAYDNKVHYYGRVTMALALATMFLPVLGEYMSSGLVPRFPSLIVSGFCMLAALLSFISGLILDCQRKRARQTFEIQLNMLSLLLRQERIAMPSGGNRPEQDL